MAIAKERPSLKRIVTEEPAESRLHIRLAEDQHFKLKMHALLRDTSVTEILQQLVEDYLKKNQARLDELQNRLKG